LAQILGIAGTETEVILTRVIDNIRNVLSQVFSVISQLLNKTLSWAGVNVDLNRIHIDVHQIQAAPSVTPSSTPGVGEAIQ
jgi:hypothetical protein